MMFKQAGDNQKAIDSFMETTNYHLLFTAITEQQLDQEDITKIINAYVTKLESKKNWKEIGEIYLNYTSEKEKSIEFLLKDGQYFKAIEAAG